MTVTINASTSSGLITTADNSGILGIQTAGTTALTIDASQNVGIGTTSPNVEAGFIGATVNGSSGSFLDFEANANHNGRIITDTNRNFSIQNPAAFAITFATNGSERARIAAAGDFLMGKTATDDSTTGFAYRASGYISVARNGGAPCYFNRTGTDGTVVEIANDSSTVGSISVSGSSTAYNTSSDYRLKNTIAPMTGALAKVALLKPVTYKWKVDGENGEGFIAHELAKVVPQCVTGEKDAIDEDGKPVYQGIDTSFLVATLTAAIQEQQAIIESLTQRITALEGAQP